MNDVEYLQSVIGHLAALDRESCSAGERDAAEWIAAELRRAGADATVEPERVHGTYWWPLGITSAAGVLATVLGRRGHRVAAAALGVASAGVVADDLGAGARWLRRLLPQRTTANVVATAGDPSAERTLILVAHHDAAHTGTFFDPRILAAVGQQFPPPEGMRPRELPAMVPMAAAPALSGLAALVGARRLSLLGGLSCAAILVSLAEVANRRTVPGANDNLTGVATLLAVARALRVRPAPGLRVLLVSTGAEEALMEGMRAFALRHFPNLDRSRTRVLCVDTVGSPHLVLPEGEGMIRVRAYDEQFKELISDCARARGITLQRGLLMRLGTDGYLALRHGFPAAMLMSAGDRGSPTNYHWKTDTADRVDYDRVCDVVELCDAVIRRLASEP